MKIRDLELKNFGKFHNKKLSFGDGIFLVYGENESGKSTIHTFIKSMLFGLERARGRAANHDTFSKYEPWENPNNYAGAMRFECGGKTFCLNRNFDRYTRKATLICEEDGEELSVESGDLEMLLSGLTSSTYEDTLYVGQLHAKTSQALAAELKNYATNYYVSGDSEIDLAAAFEHLDEKRKDVDREIKRAIQKKQRKREITEQEASYVWREIHVLQAELEEVERAIEVRDKEIQESGIKVKTPKEPQGKWRVHPLEVIAILSVCACTFSVISRPWNYLVTIVVALIGGICVWNRLKEGKKKTKTESEKMLEELESEDVLYSREKLVWEQEHRMAELKEKQIQYDNIQDELKEMDELGTEFEKLERKKRAVLMAKERMEELSQDMRKQMGDELNEIASLIIAEMTSGKYTRLFIEDNLQMSVWENGRKVSVEQLSQGTIEQIYFAFRMAVAEVFYEEDYPVLLDDTFVFYDEKRLTQTIEWLAKHKKQVVIFTCQKREEAVLEKLNIPYHKIWL